MKTFYFLLILFIAATPSFSQNWQWAKAEPNDLAQSDYSDYDDTHHSATDAQGNLYVLGDYGDSLYLNGIYRTSGRGSYLAKYSPEGNLLWYRLITSNDNTYLLGTPLRATDMIINATGIFLAGFLPQANNKYIYSIGSSDYIVDTAGYNGESWLYGSQFFLCRINLNGSVVWNKTSNRAYLGSWNMPVLSTDANNNVIISGAMLRNQCCNIGSRTFNLGTDVITDSYSLAYNFSSFSLKYTSGGTLQWSNFSHSKGGTIQDGDYIEVLGSACDNAGNTWLYMHLFNGAILGDLVFSTPHTTYDGVMAIAKINPSGNWQIIKEISTYAGAGTIVKSKCLGVDALNNVYALVNLHRNYGDQYLNTDILIPYAYLNVEPYLLKYNSSANLTWYKSFGSQYDDGATALTYSSGNLFITGYARSMGYPNNFYFGSLFVPDEICNGYERLKYFIAKADTSGKFIWTNFLCGYWSSQGFSMAAYSDNIYAAGYHQGGILNLGTLTQFPVSQEIGWGSPFVGKLKDQYIRVGAVSAIQVAPGCKISIPFTSFGLTFSAGNNFIAELSDANGDFTTPAVIGNALTSGSGVINATIPANLPMGSTGYKIRIRSTDTLATGYNYYAYADTGYTLTIACLKPTHPQVSNITSTSARLSWTPPANCVVGYQLQYKPVASSQWTTLQFAPANRNITGLLPGTAYQWRVQTGCRQSPPIGSGNINGPAFTTAAAFSTISAYEMRSTGNVKISVHPNPANTSAVLTMSENAKNATLIITDIFGKTVWRKTSVNSSQEMLPIQNLPAGIYFVKVVTGKETSVIKLTKQ